MPMFCFDSSISHCQPLCKSVSKACHFITLSLGRALVLFSLWDESIKVLTWNSVPWRFATDVDKQQLWVNFLKNKPKSHTNCDFVFISFSWKWVDWSLFCSSLYSTIPRASQGIIVHIWSTKATRAIFLNIQSLTVFNSFCDGNN